MESLSDYSHLLIRCIQMVVVNVIIMRVKYHYDILLLQSSLLSVCHDHYYTILLFSSIFLLILPQLFIIR